MKRRGRVGGSRGVTLTELMVATAILSVCILGLLSTFSGIQKSIQMSKAKTLASGLAQEKMQIVKQLNYYQVIATQAPAFDTRFTPNVPYDNANFPPETISQGGVNYTRYTYVQVADPNTNPIALLPPTTPDTGLKQITVTLIWPQSGQLKKIVLQSLLGNTRGSTSNSTFYGTVTDAGTGAPVQSALVNVAENLGWRVYTDVNGKYSLPVSPGDWHMIVTRPNYFQQDAYVTIAPDISLSQDFALTRMSTGTIGGIAWMNPSLVISQVVASTINVSGANNFDVEYITLFNPTTSQVNIVNDCSGGLPPCHSVSGAPPVQLNIDTLVNGTCYNVNLMYISTYVPAGYYYTIVNSSGPASGAPTITIGGQTITADAYYRDVGLGAICGSNGSGGKPISTNWNNGANLKHLLVAGHAASVLLSDNNNNVLDVVGWTNGVGTLATHFQADNGWPQCGVSCLPFQGAGGTNGLQAGLQVVRVSTPMPDPTPGLSMELYGQAYDSGNNQWDFLYSTISVSPLTINGYPLIHLPQSSTTSLVAGASAWTNVAGVPPIGAAVTANDGLSQSTIAFGVGFPPVATFSLLNVATGSWSVIISSAVNGISGYTLENDSVTIAGGGSIYDFPSSSTFLTRPDLYAYVAGSVTDALGVPISAPSAIKVKPGSGDPSVTASSLNGRYLLRISSGASFVDVTANPAPGNASYIQVTTAAVSIQLGKITDGVNFALAGGGQVTGFITRDGINPLPGVSVAIIDLGGYSHDQEVTDSNGRFTSIIIDTGSYVVQPSVDSLQLSSPTSTGVTITAGATVWSSTFTIIGAMGVLSGKATLSGKPLQTGALIVITTATLPGAPANPTPPPISVAVSTQTGNAYFMTSTKEDGSFSALVSSGTYNVYGWYTKVDPNTGTLTTTPIAKSGYSVLPGSTTVTSTFAW